MDLSNIELYTKAQDLFPLKIVVAGSNEHIVEATERMCDAGIIDPILVADDTEEKTVQAALHHLREDPSLVLMKGSVHSDTLMRGVLAKENGLRTEARMSHCFHMQIPDYYKQIIITDGALNVAPNQATFQHIVKNSVTLAHATGITNPLICMLSATETPIVSMPSSILANDVVHALQTEGIQNATIVGPLALDGALSKDALMMKGIEGVTDTADVLVVPNIETGNALFKLLVHMNKAYAAGVILGARVPIILNSRSDSFESRVASVAAAALVKNHTS